MERFRGSSDIPLTAQGLDEADNLGMKLAQRRGVDRIFTSNLIRAHQTAAAIHRYTSAPIAYGGPALHPWHLGGLEGQEITPDKVDFMNSLVTQHPDFKPQGRGRSRWQMGSHLMI